MPRRAPEFQTIRSEGGLLPTDLLERVAAMKRFLFGQLPAVLLREGGNSGNRRLRN
jgi:hypothetical protein